MTEPLQKLFTSTLSLFTIAIVLLALIYEQTLQVNIVLAALLEHASCPGKGKTN